MDSGTHSDELVEAIGLGVLPLLFVQLICSYMKPLVTGLRSYL